MRKRRDWLPVGALVVVWCVAQAATLAIVFGLHSEPVLQFLLVGLSEAVLLFVSSDNTSHSDV